MRRLGTTEMNVRLPLWTRLSHGMYIHLRQPASSIELAAGYKEGLCARRQDRERDHQHAYEVYSPPGVYVSVNPSMVQAIVDHTVLQRPEEYIGTAACSGSLQWQLVASYRPWVASARQGVQEPP